MTTAKQINVLFVEDEDLVVELVVGALAAAGFSVHCAGDAEDALRHVSSGAPVDVLLTDVVLPGEMDGAELATRARALRPELPVVYVSGRVSQSDLAQLVPRSIFVPKPYDPQDMCTLLGRLAPAAH